MPPGSGSRGARIHTSCAVVSAPTLDRAFAVVLDGRVRQAQLVGGCLFRPGNEDRGHDDKLSGRGASCAAIFREGPAVLGEASPERRAPLEEMVALSEFLSRRLPALLDEWFTVRDEMRASRSATDGGRP